MTDEDGVGAGTSDTKKTGGDVEDGENFSLGGN
jgi:hypothetical protein